MPGEVSRLVLEFAQLSDRRGVSSRENKLTFAGIEVLDVFERSRVDAASSNLCLASSLALAFQVCPRPVINGQTATRGGDNRHGNRS